MILDTSVLVDLLRGHEDAHAEVGRLEADGRLLWVPAPAVFELFEGIERADRPAEERRQVEAVLEGYSVLAFEPRHARRAGEVSGRLARRGAMLDPLDIQVAGVALAEDRPVLTRDETDFRRVPGLEVETYGGPDPG